MKMVHMWNTAKRTALQNKSGVTGRKLHLFLTLPVVKQLQPYVAWSSQSLICRSRWAPHPRRPGMPCVLKTLHVSWHWCASSRCTWKSKGGISWGERSPLHALLSTRRSRPWDIEVQRLRGRLQKIRSSWLPMADERLTKKRLQRLPQRGCMISSGSEENWLIIT